MKEFNLSGWALKNQTQVLYLLCALLLAGLFSYTQLAQKEDPDFTFKVMTIKLRWPGATARQIEQQLTNQLERKLQETPWLDNVSSYSRTGEAVIFVTLKDAMPPAELEHTWNQVRKELTDIRSELPDGVADPVINDHFGLTYGLIYALTSTSLSKAELTVQADKIRDQLLNIAQVNSIKLIGVQPEKIYIEFSNRQMSAFGINPMQVILALKAQNALQPAGEILAGDSITRLQVTGDFNSLESIQNIIIKTGKKTWRMNDVCHIYRSYADPADFKMRTMGMDAIGIAISLSPQGNVSRLDQTVAQEFKRIQLPEGTEIHLVSNQAAVVKKSIGEFMQALLEALTIVIAVSFLSLGLRAGLVVGLSIPLVLAGTFLLMRLFGIDLQRVSMGALIIALGLLVDDAMIAVEMMKVKLEQGYSRLHAATFAYTSTAFPMLTGTLITAAAFLPVGLAKSSAGEYTFSIFAVVSIALLVSWLVAVFFTPFIGYHLLPDIPAPTEDHYRQGFYARFRSLLEWCLNHKKSVLALTVAAFVVALFGFSKVGQEFFPPSDRPELLMDVWLPEGARFAATEALTLSLEAKLKAIPGIVNFTSYIGGSTPRFYLPLDLQLPGVNYAQIVITGTDREAAIKKIRSMLDKDFPGMGIRIARLENGPPVGYPVQFRISGSDPAKLRGIAQSVEGIVRQNRNTRNVSSDSSEKIDIIKVAVDQQKAHEHDLSSEVISNNLQAFLSGTTLTRLREGNKQIDIVARATPAERGDANSLSRLAIYNESGKSVLLGEIAAISNRQEDGIIWRTNRLPVVTVRADVPDEIPAQDVSIAIDRGLAAIRAKLPQGYRIDMGGASEDSDKAQDSIIEILPLMVFLIITLLIFQLKRAKQVTIALLTAPLGIIGVTGALLAFKVPFGFVAMLGMISLSGMIMRNSVILLDQITQDIAAGMSHRQAIIESTVRRFRPVMLTAAAAILAMIPLAQNTFWGPMAVVIMGGLLVATLLTLFFLPALYAAWYGVNYPMEKISNPP